MLFRARLALFGRWQTGAWLGTDQLGRDILSRIVWGSRTSILVAVAATLCSLIIGVTYGAFSGLKEGHSGVGGLDGYFFLTDAWGLEAVRWIRSPTPTTVFSHHPLPLFRSAIRAQSRGRCDHGLALFSQLTPQVEKETPQGQLMWRRSAASARGLPAVASRSRYF